MLGKVYNERKLGVLKGAKMCKVSLRLDGPWVLVGNSGMQGGVELKKRVSEDQEA